MWENFKDSSSKRIQKLSFLDWMNKRVLIPKYQNQAEDLFEDLSNKSPEIKLLDGIPQTPPWHTEGFFVSDHIKRMLTGIFAILDGVSLFEIEEFVSKKTIGLEIEILEFTIKENVNTFLAFVFSHDIAKSDTLAFGAESGSKGEVEGFKINKKSFINPSSDQEIVLYKKLLRVVQVSHPELNDHEILSRFFDENEISAHYYNHAIVGASSKYSNFRKKIAEYFNLTDRQVGLVRFLTRYHMNSVRSEKDYKLLMARARKIGFDGADVADLFIAQEFLDSSIGCLRYVDGRFSIDLSSVFDFIKFEKLTESSRVMQKKKEYELLNKRALKKVLKQFKLDGDSIFELLNIPFGPDREGIMDDIRDLVLLKKESVNFGIATIEIEKRIKRARDFLTK